MRIEELFSEWGIYQGPYLGIDGFQRVVVALGDKCDTLEVFDGAENSLTPERYHVSINGIDGIVDLQAICVHAASMSDVERAFDRARCNVDFLIPRADRSPIPNFKDILRAVNKVDRSRLAAAIKAMEYEDFLTTDYWRAIANYVRQRQFNYCALCPDACTEAHHADYSIHGYEHEQLNRLTALCKRCHEACLYRGRQYAESDVVRDAFGSAAVLDG